MYVTIFWGKQSITPPSAPLLNQGGDGGGNSTPPISQPVSKNPSANSTPIVVQNPPADIPKKTASVSVYNDGSYSATGSYMSPGGEDQIAVTLTLANDIITNVSVAPEPGDRTSQKYQNKFLSGYRQFVIGKNIDSVNLTKVSGSSLTPKGFDDALAQIKSQAKA